MKQASVVFVLITVFIDVLGIGLVIPILPKLVQSLLGGAVVEASFVYGAAGLAVCRHAVLLRPRAGRACRTASAGGQSSSWPWSAWASTTSC